MKVVRLSSLAAALLVALFVGLGAQNAARSNPTADPRFDRVAAALQDKMKELGVPGAALGSSRMA